MGKIQVGFLVSYDFNLLKNAIPRVYEDADTIFLAIDIDRTTWNGAPFTIDESFFDWIKSIDVDGKIVIYEDKFYVPELSTMACEVRERKLLAEQMGIGNWLVQLDADEYFLDFKSFVKTLRQHDSFLKNPEKNNIQFSTFLVNIYKFVDDGCLYIDEPTKCLTATNYPNYRIGRNTRKRIIYTKHLMLHETLSREESELEFKFENWGHKNELNPYFMEKWKTANANNYKSLTDLFYLEPHKWKSLNFTKGTTISEIANTFSTNNFAPSNWFLMKKNFGQWFKFLFKK